jgi:hypothetical protein
MTLLNIIFRYLSFLMRKLLQHNLLYPENDTHLVSFARWRLANQTANLEHLKHKIRLYKHYKKFRQSPACKQDYVRTIINNNIATIIRALATNYYTHLRHTEHQRL